MSYYDKFIATFSDPAFWDKMTFLDAQTKYELERGFGQLVGLNANGTGLLDDIEDLEYKKNSLESEVGDLEGEIEDLNAELSRVEGDVEEFEEVRKNVARAWNGMEAAYEKYKEAFNVR